MQALVARAAAFGDVALFVHGHVQGVFFRAWSTEQAIHLALRGWVRNRVDGSVEMLIHGAPRVEGNRLELEAEAFIFDASFPNAAYWKKLMRVGSPVGRLFYAPAGAKLSTGEIWDALKENRLKLPNTISIDSLGRVFLTPHQLSYTLSQRLQRADFEEKLAALTGVEFAGFSGKRAGDDDE